MSKINFDNGFTKLSNDLQKAIFSQSFSGSELKVLLAVIRLTYGYNCEEKELTHSRISDTSFVPLRTEQRALKSLIRKNIIHIRNSGTNNRYIIGVNANVDEWFGNIVTKETVKKQSAENENIFFDTSLAKTATQPRQNDDTSLAKIDDTSIVKSDDTSLAKNDDAFKDSITKDNIKDSVCNDTTQPEKKSDVEKMQDELKTYSGTAKRYFTKNEKRIFDKWVNVYHFSFDMIKAAYDRSSGYTDDLSIHYMDKILTEWHEKGITSPEKLKEKKAPVRINPDFSENHITKPSYDIDLAMKKAMMSVPKLKKKACSNI